MASLFIGTQSPYLTTTADKDLAERSVLKLGCPVKSNLKPYYEASVVNIMR